MKRKNILIIAAMVLMLAVACLLTGCGNMQMFDTTYTFNRAIISLPNGEVIEGKVDSWTDFEDGDQLQVVINGVTYLTHATNVVLISK